MRLVLRKLTVLWRISLLALVSVTADANPNEALSFVSPLERLRPKSAEVLAWEANGFRDVSVIHLDESPPSPFHVKVPVTGFVQDGARWPVSDARRMLERSRTYYRQCGIELSPLTLVTGYKAGWTFANFDPGLFNGSFNPHGKLGLFVIFMDRFLNDGTTGFAGIEQWVSHVFALNTIFMSARTIRYEKVTDPTYDILTHEFAHVLLGEHHNVIRGNVLSGRYDGIEINEAQCAQIRSRWGRRLNR